MPPRCGSQSPGRSGAGGEYEALAAGATTLVQLRALSMQYMARQREDASLRLERARAEALRRKAEADRAKQHAEQLRRALRSVAAELEARASRLATRDLEELRTAVFRGLGLPPDGPPDAANGGAALPSPVLSRNSDQCSDKENAATGPSGWDLVEMPKLRARVDQLERGQRRLEVENEALRTRCLAAERALDRTACAGCLEESPARGCPRSPPSSRATATPLRSPKRSQASAGRRLGADGGRRSRLSAPAAPLQADNCEAAARQPEDAEPALLSASSKGVGYARSCNTPVTLITMQDILEGAHAGSWWVGDGGLLPTHTAADLTIQRSSQGCSAATSINSAEPGCVVHTTPQAPERPAWAADAVPPYADAAGEARPRSPLR